MVIMSAGKARELGLKPLFKIRGFGDAARDPVEFTIAPADAVPRAYKHAGVSASDVKYHEINEAFSLVPIVNARFACQHIHFAFCSALKLACYVE